MDISEIIVLRVLQKINGSRKSSGIYYILTGKKTSQSLSDSQWFGIEQYYASLKRLSFDQFKSILHHLAKLNLIINKEENLYILTSQGKSVLKEKYIHFIFLDRLNGVKYSFIEQQCWHVIALFCQSISNAVYQSASYAPVVREREAIQQVKSIFPKSEQTRKVAAEELYSELFRVLKEVDTFSAEVFVRKLSGFDRIGLTFEQLANELSLSKLECMLRFKSVLHHLISSASEKSADYPVIFSCLGKYIDTPPLTNSALQTYELLKNKKTVSEIMKIRRLKESTLEDHLVEIARTIPQFSIYPYISEEDSKQVVLYLEKTRELKLRPIKEAFPRLSYLQIRLVLAKEGGKNESGNSVKTNL
jgi:uncharacterized protein YpbB